MNKTSRQLGLLEVGPAPAQRPATIAPCDRCGVTAWEPTADTDILRCVKCGLEIIEMGDADDD